MFSAEKRTGHKLARVFLLFLQRSSSGRILSDFLVGTENGEGKVKKTWRNSGDVNFEAAAFFACKLFGGSDKEPFDSTISESKSRPDYHIKAPLKTSIGFLNVDLIPYSQKRSYCYQHPLKS